MSRLAPLLLLAAVGCGGSFEPEPEAPHLLLVVADALRRDHLGVYGYDQRPTSPFLDRLAREGVTFDDAHAQASQTFNSTSTLLTSRLFPYLGEPPGLAAGTGLDRATRERHAQVPVLRPENLTLAEVLAGGGYDTFGAFSNPHHHPASGFWQGFAEARFVPPKAPRTAYAPGPKVVRAFLDWLDGRSGRETPVFAYLHFMDTHNPYRPPREIRRQFVTAGGRDLYRNGRPVETPTAADLDYMRALYDGEIRWFDGVLAALVEALSERGLWQRTVLVVAADHGDEFMEHGGLGHGMTLEPEVLRVPLMFAGPALTGAGVAPGRVAALVRNLDLAPTLAELAGLRPPAEFEGSSLLPRMRGGETEVAPPSFAWLGSLRSVTTERWHISLDLETGERRLYDRRSDPGGRLNAIADHPQAAADLARLLDALEDAKRRAEEEAARLGPQQPPAELDPAVREQLEALGYLD